MSRRNVHFTTQVSGEGPVLPPQLVEVLRAQLPTVADRAVGAIIEEVPTYTGAFAGPMGNTIRNAVQFALGGFLTLASRAASGPMSAAIEGAYQLGRGEARSGRSAEALLSAYRIGARVSWRDMSQAALHSGIDAAQLSRFAELVFAYIDELSAASVAGHADELQSSGRLRQRNLERLARALLSDADPESIVAAAERAEWVPPAALTAVVLPESQVAHALTALDAQTLQAADNTPGVAQGSTVLLVPTSGTLSASRPALLAALRGSDAVVGPSLSWLEVAASLRRALRCVALGFEGIVDTDEQLRTLVLDADPRARSDLRSQVLAPLQQVRPSTAEKLTDTLRAWLRHQGRRDAVAQELFVHAQTVRYRVGQLRELYGDRLEDPTFILDATLALA